MVSGKVFVGLFDLRAGSPTEGRPEGIRLSGEEPRQALYIPPGVAHGFYAETDIVLQYLVDTYFTGEDEFGVAWNDPELGLNWPGSAPILASMPVKKFATLRCRTITPFGLPVEPEV